MAPQPLIARAAVKRIIERMRSAMNFIGQTKTGFIA